MNILSIQSHVAYGHVGNAAAVFPLQRMGVEVWPVNTVQFSNHTGYGAWRGHVLSGAAIRLLLQGLQERGVLGRCDGVLSGYLGSRATGEAVVDAVGRVKHANPAARYCCDPVIGNVERGVFVRRGLPRFINECMLPLADVITPNQFELGYLAGSSAKTRADLTAALDALHARGPRVVFVTSLALEDTPADVIDLAVSDGSGCWRTRVPRLPIVANGAGDIVAALFFAHHLRGCSAGDSMALAASSLFGVLRRTAEAGTGELLLVDAQEEFAAPSRSFVAQPI
ncbi:MAG TPA: pyridoxal kinase PdxY [Xanthobacteraceae bacterium]|jgi:pyridoxine kinase